MSDVIVDMEMKVIMELLLSKIMKIEETERLVKGLYVIKFKLGK